MARALQSWTRGEWWAGGGHGVEVADAVTGEPVVTVSSKGLDAAATVAYAREVGGPELGRSGFAERAAPVQQLTLALKERCEELIELSARTGATAADASVDVVGGIGTAAVFASKGAKQLPAGNVPAEGEAEQLGRGGTFAARHFLTPRRGVESEAVTARSVRFNAEADSLNGSVLGPWSTRQLNMLHSNDVTMLSRGITVEPGEKGKSG